MLLAFLRRIFGASVLIMMTFFVRGGFSKRSESLRLIFAALCGVSFGLFVGTYVAKLILASSLVLDSYQDQLSVTIERPLEQTAEHSLATALPQSIIVSKSDLYLRRLWGIPDEDLPNKPKHLLVITVGMEQKKLVDKMVAKFTEKWMIVLFHYDGQVDGWDEYEWSQRSIHISARKQTKWWYAKRFLHPDVVEPFEYIFIWDEDLDGEHFSAEEYIKLVRKYDLEISQPGVEGYFTWNMTRRMKDVEVHKVAEERRQGWCDEDTHKPPCGGFVEIMAPVFSRKSWRCIWHMIQNDLVHGWGLDFVLQKCAQPAHEKIGVVDAQYIIHRGVPSLGNQGNASDERPAWHGVRERCQYEWDIFKERVRNAEELQRKQRRGDAKELQRLH